MPEIRILDDHIANQIAAGEVVERPSSVVKELVENAIDAGSTMIDITVEDGGLQFIRVSDNGSGITASELKKAFMRHATSKISSGQDLFRIRTLGFRGEALPSIAAVAKVECVTATDDSGLGQRIVIEGGEVKEFAETVAPKGTDIRVKELFYNTPARLKYMKTVQTELGHVSDYVYRLALSKPDISFTLKHNGSVLLQTLGNGDLLQVVAGIYGTAHARKMIPVSGEDPDFRIWGYVGKPEVTRSNRYAITTIVNGRYIRHYGLVQAILKAYHTLLPINRFPLAVLHLEMDPILLDVNVHPAKLEIRFSKEAELLALVEQAIRSALLDQRLIPTGNRNDKAKPAVVQEALPLYRPHAAEMGDRVGSAQQSDSGQSEWTTRLGDMPAQHKPVSANRSGESPVHADQSPGRPGISGQGEATAEGRTASYSGESVSRRKPARDWEAGRADKWLDALAPERTASSGLPAFPRLEPIGQLHGTYIVAQNEDGLYLIDQHAAHERINYEYYYDKFGQPQEASQELLMPLTLEMTPSDAAILRERLSLMEHAGIRLEPFGGSTFLVRAYPHWFPEGDEMGIIEEMAAWIVGEKKAIDLSRFREASAIMCSCKASIKANQSLSIREMEALLDRLAACRVPYTCPHGRPIVVSFSTYELQKMFKRVM